VTTSTIQEAAAATGWSARMLRYVEQLGLVEAPRSAAGYRLYGPAQLQRLRSLRALLETHGVELGDVGFALRLRREADLAQALDDWFDDTPRTAAPTPRTADDADWLGFEQDKHQQLLHP
jgi:MerR family copper efflux transcriptional regulator